MTRTDDELSVIAPDDVDLGPGDRQAGWSCLQIAEMLDFAMVGVIAGISKAACRCEHQSTFAVSDS